MMKVGTRVHREVYAVRFHYLSVYFQEYHIHEYYILCIGNYSIEIKADYMGILEGKYFYFFVFEKCVAESGAPMVQSINGQMEFSIQDVIKNPLVVVWEIMIQSKLHYIRQLKDLVISCWIDETWCHIVV